MKVRYRKGPAVTVYRKTAKYPFYRIAYKADGKRIVRSFSTYAVARKEADTQAQELYKGNHAGAALPKSAALAYTLATRKLAELARDLNAAKPDLAAPDISFTLDEAIAEYVEAKRVLGPVPLVEAVRTHLARAVAVRRMKLADAAAEFLKEREARTRPEKEGARPRLSTTMFIQDRLRMERFTDAFQMDLCDLRAEHLDLFFGSHLGKLSPKSRNHYRGTVGLFIKWAVRRKYLAKDHGLEDEFSADGGHLYLTRRGDFFLIERDGWQNPSAGNYPGAGASAPPKPDESTWRKVSETWAPWQSDDLARAIARLEGRTPLPP